VSNGGFPATIGVINGVARIGMQAEELIELVSKAGQTDNEGFSEKFGIHQWVGNATLFSRYRSGSPSARV
jgi:Indigoidine synthase A like protein